MCDATNKRSAKGLLRREMRDRRRALSQSEVVERSAVICARIEELPKFSAAKTVCLYLPFDGEVDVLPLIQKHFGQKRIVSTRALRDGGLELREVRKFDDLAPGAFGILEPTTGCPLIEPGDIDLFLVPGTAFDRQNHRLGFGVGHYDRMLAKSSGYRVGVAYDFQIVAALPVEQHDVPMHTVIHD